jgi:hypothetical protein
VLFEPWYTDTTFLAIEEHRVELPGAARLSAYPNPFNNSCRILLEVKEPVIVRVELYDLLGRRVRELWAGPVALPKEITVDGSGLGSGIYFVRAARTVDGQGLATVKVGLVK